LPFTPTFTFQVKLPWHNNRAWADGGEIAQGKVAIDWASGIKQGTRLGKVTAIGQGASKLVEFVTAYPGFTVSAPVSATIGGVSATQIDVSTNTTTARNIFLLSQDSINYQPGEKFRMFVLETGGKTVLITIESVIAADFDTSLAAAQPVVDSIEWP
jgi:hypothetical protein